MDHAERVGHVRIAHLTDLHVGRVTPMRLQMLAVEMTNREKPDLVAITGDFVCHSQAFLADLEEVVRGFDAPVFATLGNHDHWSGGEEVRRALKRAGAEVLDNAHTTISIRKEQIQLVGLDDAYTGHADRQRATKGLRADLPSIGLSHIAEEADALWRLGIPLVLSGHTHAGQVTVARLHELAIGKLAGHKYIHGLYGSRKRVDGIEGAVYVGAGIGAAVMPFRFGDRGKREIAIFELGHVPGSFAEHHPEQPPLRGRKPSIKTEYKRAMAVEKKRTKRERQAVKGTKKKR